MQMHIEQEWEWGYGDTTDKINWYTQWDQSNKLYLCIYLEMMEAIKVL